MEGLIGRKIGMTQVYDDQGRRIAVTVLEAGPCPVVQVKTPDTDGYRAAQLGFDEQNGVPVGMMFGADRGEDAMLLQLALELEGARPWPGAAPQNAK